MSLEGALTGEDDKRRAPIPRASERWKQHLYRQRRTMAARGNRQQNIASPAAKGVGDVWSTKVPPRRERPCETVGPARTRRRRGLAEGGEVVHRGVPAPKSLSQNALELVGGERIKPRSRPKCARQTRTALSSSSSRRPTERSDPEHALTRAYRQRPSCSAANASDGFGCRRERGNRRTRSQSRSLITSPS